MNKNFTIRGLHESLVNKEVSSLEVTQEYFKRIKEQDGELGAYLSLNEEQALRAAEYADIKIAKGEVISSLTGVPVALKDNMCLEGSPTTAASKILEHYVAGYDAGVVAKLKKEGAVILGKTNLDEFAMGSSTENSAFKVTKNPHDRTRVAGGSSGGSAAAVAADLAVASLGSDTGGSIRLPAAFCGVVGMKPTYGAVSRSGIIALASSLDQVGPFAKTVEDTTTMFEAIRGYDTMDATSARDSASHNLHKSNEELKGLTIGIPDEYFVDGVDGEVGAAIQNVIKTFEKMGLKTKRVSLPHTKYALSCYYILLPAEVSSNLARFDGVRYARHPDVHATSLKELYVAARGQGFGPETKRRVILGTFVLSSGYYDAYYGKAQAVRALVAEDFENAFEDVDVLLTPVAPSRAFKVGEKVNDPLSMYLTDIFTIPVNLAGLPGISIPVKGVQGLPIGFQLIGKAFHEADILGLGQLYEQEG